MGLIQGYLSRVLAAVVAGISAWLGVKLGIDFALSPEEQAGAVGGLVSVLFLAYGALHRWIDGFINPADAAKPAAK